MSRTTEGSNVPTMKVSMACRPTPLAKVIGRQGTALRRTRRASRFR